MSSRSLHEEIGFYFFVSIYEKRVRRNLKELNIIHANLWNSDWYHSMSDITIATLEGELSLMTERNTSYDRETHLLLQRDTSLITETHLLHCDIKIVLTCYVNNVMLTMTSLSIGFISDIMKKHSPFSVADVTLC